MKIVYSFKDIGSPSCWAVLSSVTFTRYVESFPPSESYTRFSQVAASKGKMDAVDLLLLHNADVSQKSRDGSNARHWAERFHRPEVAARIETREVEVRVVGVRAPQLACSFLRSPPLSRQIAELSKEKKPLFTTRRAISCSQRA